MTIHLDAPQRLANVKLLIEELTPEQRRQLRIWLDQPIVKTYPGEFSYLSKSKQRYVKTGEFRAPKKGEYYLSGAIPCAYRAPNDYLPNDKFFIMKEHT
jgi:hypothetical protein